MSGGAREYSKVKEGREDAQAPGWSSVQVKGASAPRQVQGESGLRRRDAPAGGVDGRTC